jgi:two-component system OmpR family sensor kinase
MGFLSAFSRRLYLRIWLAVVAGVAVLTLLVGWAWRVAADYNTPPPTPREILVRNAAGELIGSAVAEPGHRPGMGLEFSVTLADGQTLVMQMPPRQRRMQGGGPPPAPAPYWTRPPYGFLWMLALVSIAVALGVYPIVRRLTQRLETLQRGVQRWGDGDLSARVPVQGEDEVADLSARFNSAAERIEALMATQHQLLASQKSLLANASHELRSPLTRIRMGMELMGSQPGPAFREEISRNIAELDQLIDEILLASRLDAREADMGTVESIDLLGLAVEESARAGAGLELAEGVESLLVPGVAKLLRRLVRNLLENARRYGGAAGTARHHGDRRSRGRKCRAAGLRPRPRCAARPARAHFRTVLSPARRQRARRRRGPRPGAGHVHRRAARRLGALRGARRRWGLLHGMPSKGIDLTGMPISRYPTLFHAHAKHGYSSQGRALGLVVIAEAAVFRTSPSRMRAYSSR